MQLSVEHDSSASVEQMYAAHLDHAVREEACRQSGALRFAVDIAEHPGGGARIQVDRTMPATVPDFIRKFVGETIEVRQVEEWTAADADGVRRAAIRLTIKGQPASMDGQAVLRPAAAGSTETVSGDVKVAIPLVGRKIEPEIVKVVTSGLRVEQRVTAAAAEGSKRA